MNDIFLKACRGEEVPYTPVWIMRQAGRYLPEYQAVRAEVDFLTLCKTPELAAKVTLQPVEKLKVDAAILFSDILIAVEAMGMHLEFSDRKGPVLSDPVRTKSGIDRLVIPDTEDSMPFVIEAIKILRSQLNVPLIGFSGAPFTLATYMIEGGSSKNFLNTKRMMFQNPGLFSLLMDKITMTVISYLSSQIRAGAQAVQLFDTWAGALAPEDYKEFVLPSVKRAIAELKKEGVPVIYFVNECAALLKEIKKTTADVIGIDWRIDLKDAIKGLGKKFAVQGNLDPCALFLPHEKMEDKVKDILWKGEFAKGHIFNLGHGILPESPAENAVALVEAVHRFSER
ncbi:MAG: uroporphyrinogen decarboxylase [Nitrospirae bacterium]|nr:uroporphyrinogen decarboxylase [Nitrospirota bacterium]MCL5423410.1 uroporphyrinogen decarboxylase [Nitrospirota bacterium]